MTDQQTVVLTKKQRTRREQARRRNEALDKSAEFAVQCITRDFTDSFREVCAVLVDDRNFITAYDFISDCGLKDSFPFEQYPDYFYDYIRSNCDKLARLFHYFGVDVEPAMELKAAIRERDELWKLRIDHAASIKDIDSEFLKRIDGNAAALTKCFDCLSIKVGGREVAPEPHLSPVDVDEGTFAPEHYLNELIKLASDRVDSDKLDQRMPASLELPAHKVQELNLSKYDRWAIYLYLIQPELLGKKPTQTEVASMVVEAAQSQSNPEVISYQQHNVCRAVQRARPLMAAMGISLFAESLKPQEFPAVIQVSPAILDMGPRVDGLTARQRDRHYDDNF